MPIRRKKKIHLSIIMKIGLSSKTSRHDCVTSCSSYLENTGSLESPPGFPESHFENCCSVLMQPLGPAHSSKRRVLKQAAILAPPQQDGQNTTESVAVLLPVCTGLGGAWVLQENLQLEPTLPLSGLGNLSWDPVLHSCSADSSS